MKRILVLLLAVQAIDAFRQRGPPPRHVSSESSSSDDSSLSSEEEDFGGKTKVQPPTKGRFLDRPSSEELAEYDAKLQRQNGKNRKLQNQENKKTEEEEDEKLFLATLGQLYLQKMDEEPPMGPPMMDPDYYFYPINEDVPKEANNNGNNNVNVNVNHVQVNSNVVHVPVKKERPHHEMAPIIPQHFSEPTVTSKYLYLNFNVNDCLFLVALLAIFVFVAMKVYAKCFMKKQKAPQLPTTLPPTYSPSTITVETVPKKVVSQ
uniref:Uncharacterized protein n=2 Tax=Caenorhabditis japonica TaxID=281687 RepID=A0A8R1I095_CAEJA